jgi:hypothetical protein
MMRSWRKSFVRTLFGQAALRFLKKLLVAYAKLVDVNFGIRIKGPTIRFAFMRGSTITHVSPSLGF